MKQIVTALRSDTKIRYIVIGGLSFLVEVAVLFVAQGFGAPGTLAVALSFLVGLGVSFLLQKVITFKDSRFNKKMLGSQLFVYGALVAFNFGFTITAVWLLEAYLPVAYIRIAALALTTIWNYYLYRSWIFNKTA